MTTALAPVPITAASDHDLSIRLGRFSFSPYGLVVEGEPTFDEWEECGAVLSRAEKAVHWWLGDWLLYGERRFGERYSQALEETRFSYGTLRNDAWVASRFPAGRRHESLSFSHHREVAPLPPADQDHWLQQAERGDGEIGPDGIRPWSSKRLRQELRQAGHRLVPDDRSDLSVHYLSGSDDWLTPDHVIQRVVQLLGAIDLDPCSNEGPPNVPATRHYRREHDGLAQEWAGRVYCNPPYGRVIPDWVTKLCRDYQQGRVSEAVTLLPARTDTDWFRLLRDYAVCFVDGRLRFSNSENSAPFPSMVVYLGERRDAFAQVFAGMGDVWVRYHGCRGAVTNEEAA